MYGILWEKYALHCSTWYTLIWIVQYKLYCLHLKLFNYLLLKYVSYCFVIVFEHYHLHIRFYQPFGLYVQKLQISLVNSNLLRLCPFNGSSLLRFKALDLEKQIIQGTLQDTVIIAWKIRHPTRDRNDWIARVELYQRAISPRDEWSTHEIVRFFFYSFP